MWLMATVAMLTMLSPDDLADVNGKKITSEQVDLAFKKTSVALREKELTEKQLKLYRKHILNHLVDDELIHQFLDSKKITVEEKSVDDHIEQIKQQLKSQGKTIESFLKQMNITEETMKQDIRRLYRWLNYVESQATDKVLRSYFEANKNFFDGSTVKASHILIKVDSDADQATRDAAKKKIESIKAELAKGGNFAELAKKHSECPSRMAGGDLSYFGRKGMMTEPFAVAAFDLPANKVSDPVETEFGYHLIMVTDKKAGKEVKFEDVQDDVKSLYAEDLKRTVVASLRNKVEVKFLR